METDKVNKVTHFVLGKKISDLSRAEDVVKELQELLVLNVIVCEYEGDALPLQPGEAIQDLYVVHKITHVVRSETVNYPYSILSYTHNFLQSIKYISALSIVQIYGGVRGLLGEKFIWSG